MTVAQRIDINESPEALLLREIEGLIYRLVAGKASPADLQRLQELQKQRVEMMTPKAKPRTRALA